MKIIFCDIDGVLNSDYFTLKNGGNRSDIEEKKVINLKKIVLDTGAKVVIVSHANGLFGKEYDQQRLDMIRKYGVDPIDSLNCKRFMASKDEVVKKWIDSNLVSKYIILDDSKDNYSNLSNRMIHIKGKHGLTNQYVLKAIKLLND